MNHDNKNRDRNSQKQHCRKSHCGHGPTSFHMHDPEPVFENLALQDSDILLDLGCGTGDYSMYAANIIGECGKIYALDIWQDMLHRLYEKASARGINNILPVVSDIRERIDFPDDTIDACLVAAVLHTIASPLTRRELYAELRRILKPGGRLVMIESKKEESTFGPPLHMRLAPDEIEKGLEEFGFEKVDYTDLGANYMLLFVL